MSSKASTCAALGLADVDREPRLVAGPVEVDRVAGPAAVPDRQVEAGQAVVELAPEPGRGAGEPRRRPRRGRSTATSAGLPPSSALASAPRGQRAQRAQRQGQHPRPPLARLRRARARARTMITPAPRLEVGADLGRAGEDVAAIGHLAREDGARRRRRRPPRSPTPASASARARAPAASRPSAAIAGSGSAGGAVAQLADDGVRDPQLDRVTSSPPGEQLALLVGRGAGDGEHGAGAVDQGDAGAQHLAPRRARSRAARHRTRSPRRARRACSGLRRCFDRRFSPLWTAAGIRPIIQAGRRRRRRRRKRASR